METRDEGASQTFLLAMNKTVISQGFYKDFRTQSDWSDPKVAF